TPIQSLRSTLLPSYKKGAVRAETDLRRENALRKAGDSRRLAFGRSTPNGLDEKRRSAVAGTGTSEFIPQLAEALHALGMNRRIVQPRQDMSRHRARSIAARGVLRIDLFARQQVHQRDVLRRQEDVGTDKPEEPPDLVE